MAGARTLLARLRIPSPPKNLAGHQSFLVYRKGFYLKLALLLSLLCIVIYAFHEPVEGPSGSTWLGYTYGVVGLVLISWLAWLGIRKRQYRESRLPVQDWVSAHVYLGLLLIIVGTLHTGFQFGWNVHTLAYTLMMSVVLSGIYGVIAYARLPPAITHNRNQMEFQAMLDEIARLNQTALNQADRIDPETHAMVVRSVSKVRIGGNAWEQLTGKYRVRGDSGAFDRFINLKRTQLEAGSSISMPARSGRQATIAFVADQMFSSRNELGSQALQKLLQAIAERKKLVERINRDISLRSRMTVWLYIHVPVTVMLLVSLAAHVLSVFLYW